MKDQDRDIIPLEEFFTLIDQLENNISMVIDPLDKFPELGIFDAVELCGFIPQWALSSKYELPLKEKLEKFYVFGMYQMKKSEVDEKGVMTYPGDPDLFPLIKIKYNDETLYQYNYGIVAIVQEDGSSFVTRMD